MIDYVAGKVEGVVAGVLVSDNEIPLDSVKDSQLPFCMIHAVSGEDTLIDFKQREEVTSMTVSFVDKFDATDKPLRSLLDTHQLIKEAIWDGNAIDTDAAGFFAYMTGWGTGKPEPSSDRHVLQFEVVFETMDAADSAFALVEDSA